MWRHFLFRAMWIVSVPLPTIIVGLVVLYFIGEALEPPTESSLGVVFGGAALVLTLAALAFSATRAHDERRESAAQTGDAIDRYWHALKKARTEFRIAGVHLLQSGYLLSIGAALLYAARSISDWGGIVKEGSAVLDAVGWIGKLAVGAAAGAGWVGCWWLAKAFWTSQHEDWLPARSPRRHARSVASQAGRTEEAGVVAASPPPEPPAPRSAAAPTNCAR